jgi:hypothetical protein
MIIAHLTDGFQHHVADAWHGLFVYLSRRMAPTRRIMASSSDADEAEAFGAEIVTAQRPSQGKCLNALW